MAKYKGTITVIKSDLEHISKDYAVGTFTEEGETRDDVFQRLARRLFWRVKSYHPNDRLYEKQRYQDYIEAQSPEYVQEWSIVENRDEQAPQATIDVEYRRTIIGTQDVETVGIQVGSQSLRISRDEFDELSQKVRDLRFQLVGWE